MTTAAIVTSPGWSISASRTLAVPAVGTTLRGVSAIPQILTWPDKAMADQLDYGLDASAWLADLGGDKLASASVVIITPNAAPYDLQSPWSALVGTTLVCWLIGGAPFQAYGVTLVFKTMLGRLLAQTVQIRIGG